MSTSNRCVSTLAKPNACGEHELGRNDSDHEDQAHLPLVALATQQRVEARRGQAGYETGWVPCLGPEQHAQARAVNG